MNAAEYRAERDRHGRRLDGSGCRCGIELDGNRLAAHIISSIAAASRAYEERRGKSSEES